MTEEFADMPRARFLPDEVNVCMEIVVAMRWKRERFIGSLTSRVGDHALQTR